LDEFFYYPQRLIASIFVSLFAISFLHAMLINFNLSAKAKIIRSISIAEDNFQDSLSSALNMIASEKMTGVLREEEFKKLFDSSKVLYEFVRNLSLSYYIGFLGGTILADAI
jgi:hypothetical protein